MNVMEPQLVKTEKMIGSDERNYLIQMWIAYRLNPRATSEDATAWIASTEMTFKTDDGQPVDCEDQRKGIFRIRGTHVTLRSTH
jgi:hypothetical protein